MRASSSVGPHGRAGKSLTMAVYAKSIVLGTRLWSMVHTLSSPLFQLPALVMLPPNSTRSVSLCSWSKPLCSSSFSKRDSSSRLSMTACVESVRVGG